MKGLVHVVVAAVLAVAAVIALASVGHARVPRFEGHAAQAPITFSVTTPDGAPAGLAAAEAAVTEQVNRQVRRHWNVPPIQFGAVGIPVTVESKATVNHQACLDSDGCHTFIGGTPVIFVADDTPDLLSIVLSHEVIETLTDPQMNGRDASGDLIEPCDPVQNAFYDIGDTVVSDFVYPRWFDAGSRGQWDWMGAVTSPGTSLHQG